jgi:hypothetical protein
MKNMLWKIAQKLGIKYTWISGFIFFSSVNSINFAIFGGGFANFKIKRLGKQKKLKNP